MKAQIHRIKTALTHTRRRKITSTVIAGAVVLAGCSTGTAAIALEVRQPKVVEVVVEEAVPTAMVDEAPAYVPLAWLDEDQIAWLSELGLGDAGGTSTALIRLGDRWLQIGESSPFMWESAAAREALTSLVLNENWDIAQHASDTAAAIQGTAHARVVFLARGGDTPDSVILVGAYSPHGGAAGGYQTLGSAEEGRAAFEAAEAGWKLDLTQF